MPAMMIHSATFDRCHNNNNNYDNDRQALLLANTNNTTSVEDSSDVESESAGHSRMGSTGSKIRFLKGLRLRG